MNKTLLNWIGRAISITVVFCFSVLSVQAQSEKEAKLAEGLKVYNALLEKQITAQKAAKQEIEISIQQSTGLERQLSRVLSDMLQNLEQFVASDLPFRKASRQEDIARLKGIMLDSQVPASARFRSIMDVYSIELEYGNTTEAYPESILIDGKETPVDILRVGRLAMYYQTKNQKQSGMWDSATKNWKTLESGVNRDIRKAIKVAAKTVAPELISLPINAPEGV